MTKRASLFIALALTLWGGESSAFSCPGGQYKKLVVFADPDAMNHPSGSAVTCFTALNGTAFPSFSAAWAAAEACQPAGSSSSYNPGLYYARFTTELGPSGIEANEPANPGQYTALQKIATRYRNSDNLDFGTSASYGYIIVQVQAQCSTEPVEEDQECEAGDYNGALTSSQRTTYAYPNDQGVCVDGCVSDRQVVMGVDVPGLGDNLTGPVWVMTGASCGPSGSGESPTPIGPDCETVNGNYVCRSDNVNCITVNGEEVCGSGAGGVCQGDQCLDDGELLEYLQLDDGAVITDDDAPTPPKPDNGTPNNEADPDLPLKVPTGEREDGSGNGTRDYNYYNSTTVGNSSEPPGYCDPQVEECDGEYGGDCDPETEECGASITGGQKCNDKPVCEGDPVECFIAHKEWQIWCSSQLPKESDLEAAIDEGLTDNGQHLSEYLEGQTYDAGEWFELPEANACSIEDIEIDIPWLGTSIVPLSDFCALFSTIGLFVLAGAAMRSLHIVLTGLG